MNRARIRPALGDDAPAVLELLQELAEHEGLGPVVALTEATLRDLLDPADDRLVAFVAELEHEVVGYVTCTPRYSIWRARPFVYLDDVYVRPVCRGRGIGSDLIRSVLTLAARRGERVAWDARPENHAALALYRRLGAELTTVVACRWAPG